MNIGEELKRLREKGNLTQYALAKKVGTTQHCISQIEKGAKEPSRKLFAAIIDTLTKCEECQNKDFFSIISIILQFFIPGCQCSLIIDPSPDCHPDLCVELPSGFRASLNITTNKNRAHDPVSQAVFASVLEDLTLRDAIQKLLYNDDLKKFLIEAEKNADLKRIMEKLYYFKDKPEHLDFFETNLDSLLIKAKSKKTPQTH
jgi:DNA-binding XRE family transcriptional regulator